MEACTFFSVGQVTLEEQIASVEKVAMAGQLLDGVTTVQQLAFVAVNEGDGRLARCGRQKTRVVGEHAGLCVELTDVHHIRTHGAVVHRQVNAGRAVAEGECGFVVCEFHFYFL